MSLYMLTFITQFHYYLSRRVARAGGQPYDPVKKATVVSIFSLFYHDDYQDFARRQTGNVWFYVK